MIAGGCVLSDLLVRGPELLFGRWGLLVMRDAVPLELSALLWNVPKYRFKHYSALLLLLAPALTRFMSYRCLAILSAAVMVPHACIVVKLTLEDNTFLLKTDLFFACWLATGAHTLIHAARWRALIAVSIAGHLGLLAYTGASFTIEPYRAMLRRCAVLLEPRWSGGAQ